VFILFIKFLNYY